MKSPRTTYTRSVAWTVATWFLLGVLTHVAMAEFPVVTRREIGGITPSPKFGSMMLAATGTVAVCVYDGRNSGQPGLFSMAVTGGPPIRISQPLTNGDFIGDYFWVHSNGTRVVYCVQGGPATNWYAIYSVSVFGGPPTRLSSPLVAGGHISNFLLSPDGTRVVYYADQDSFDRYELYSVPLGGGQVTKINGALVTGGDVVDYWFSPDSQRVVYRAIQTTAGVVELYSTSITNSIWTKLSGTMVSGGNVLTYDISPNSQWVVFEADRITDNVQELFSVPVAGGSITKLNGTLTTGGDIGNFEFSPDGSTVVYRADQQVNNDHELFSVPIVGGQAPVKLNGPLITGVSDVDKYWFTADGTRVIFSADLAVNESYDVYSVAVSGGVPMMISSPHGVGRSVAEFMVVGNRVVYRSDVLVDERHELYSVASSGGLVSPLNTGWSGGSGVYADYWPTPDGSRIVYRAETTGPGAVELFSVPIAGGPGVKISSTLISEAGAESYWVSTQRVGFVAHPQTNGLRSLRSARILGGSEVTYDFGYVGENVLKSEISPDGSNIVYLARPAGGGAAELYQVARTGGVPVRLNNALARLSADPDQEIVDFSISPDGQRVVYRGAQDTAAWELYSVPIRGGSVAKLNGVLISGGHVYDFAISPNSTRVVFRADQTTDDVVELYSALIEGGSHVKLNGQMGISGDVDSDYAISPDGSRVVYIADQNINNVHELFSTPIHSSSPVRLHGTLAGNNGDVHNFVFTPDGTRVVYLADQDVDEDDELYSTPTVGGGSTQLNANMLSGISDVAQYRISTDSSRVIYLADSEINEVYNLFSAPIGGGVVVPLSGSLEAGLSVFYIQTRGAHAVYRADQESDGVSELFSVPVAGGTVTKINDTLIAGGGVTDYELSPDGAHTLYRADQDELGAYELFSVPTSGGRVLRVHPDLGAGGDVTPSFRFTSDGQRAVYIADQNTNDVQELYTAVVTSGEAVKLSQPLPAGSTGVVDYVIDPDSRLFCYRADVDGDGGLDLLAAEFHDPVASVEGFYLGDFHNRTSGDGINYAQAVSNYTQRLVPFAVEGLPANSATPQQAMEHAITNALAGGNSAWAGYWLAAYIRAQTMLANEFAIQSMQVGYRVANPGDPQTNHVALYTNLVSAQVVILDKVDLGLAEIRKATHYATAAASLKAYDLANGGVTGTSSLSDMVRAFDVFGELQTARNRQTLTLVDDLQRVAAVFHVGATLLAQVMDVGERSSVGLDGVFDWAGEFSSAHEVAVRQVADPSQVELAGPNFVPNPSSKSLQTFLSDARSAVASAKSEWRIAQAEQRQFDTDQTALAQALQSLRQQYLSELHSLTGVDPVDYDDGGVPLGSAAAIADFLNAVSTNRSGKLNQFRLEMEYSLTNVLLATTQQENWGRRIRNEQRRSTQVMYYTTNSFTKLRGLEQEQAKASAYSRSGKWKKVVDYYTNDTDNIFGFGEQKRVYKRNADGSLVRKFHAKTDGSYNPNFGKAAREGSKIREINAVNQASIINAESASRVKDMKYSQTEAGLHAAVSLKEADLKRQQLANAEQDVQIIIDNYVAARADLASAYFSNPAYRLIRDEAVVQADGQLKQAQQDVYEFARRLEYEWAERFPRPLSYTGNLPAWNPAWNVYTNGIYRLFATVNPFQVEEFLFALKAWDAGLRMHPTIAAQGEGLVESPLYGQRVSLRRDILGLSDVAFNGLDLRPPDIRQNNLAQFDQFIQEHKIDASVPGFPLRSTGRSGLVLTFPLQLEGSDSVSVYFGSSRWNQRIDAMDFNIVGRSGVNPQGMPSANVKILQRGAAFIRKFGGTLLAFSPETYLGAEKGDWGIGHGGTVVGDYKATVNSAGRSAVYFNPSSNIDPMLNRPVAATEWTIFIDNGDQLGGAALDFSRISDIEILVRYKHGKPAGLSW